MDNTTIAQIVQHTIVKEVRTTCEV